MKKRSSGMNIIITDNYNEMSEKAAEIMASEITVGPDACYGFATGGTPVGMYKAMIAMCKAGKLDFSKLTTFNLDEYYPIKKTNDQSYDYFMRENLFNHVNVDFSRVNIPNGETEDAGAECAAYEKKIETAGGIHMQLLGLGLNGHVGFNEPSDHFTRATHVVTLTQSTIDANKRFFAKEGDVPRQALTMGAKTIMMAKKILIIVSGSGKADIVKAFIHGEITPQVPASVLQMHQDVTVVLDREAAAKL